MRGKSKPPFLVLFGVAVIASASHGQDSPPPPGVNDLPEVRVTAPPITATYPTLPFGFPASGDKTDTPIEDVPRSIEIVPHQLFEQQGATQLRDTLRDVSGTSEGGQFAFGFFDRFVVRGLNPNFLDDGLPDETSDLSGIPHSLTGVERVEVIKGPGSALYGSSEPGGTINLVHFRPSDTSYANVTEQLGSFGTTTTSLTGTGPTKIPDLDWRFDGGFQNSSGFRGLHQQIGEALPALRWHPQDHDVNLRFEYHHYDIVPDATGIPFSPPTGTGLPLAVPITSRYYTPFAKATQDIARVFASDTWKVDDVLSVNNRFSFSNRTVDILRNAGGSVTPVGSIYELTNRQLRRQDDNVSDYIYQLEPNWHFQPGSMKHSLLTGFELRRVDADSVRATADLPNILNIFQPIVPEQSEATLTFRCDAQHSCYNDRLWARYYGVYAIDQIDVTEAFKLRLSGRQDWFTTAAEARIASPTNPGNVHPCPSNPAGCPLIPGQPVLRYDAPFSWEAGAVYFIRPRTSIFAGYSDASYPIFNTEEPQTIGQAPERSRQYEVGLRYELPVRIAISTAAYQATRENVYVLNTIPNPNGPGNFDEAAFFDYRVRGWETDLNVNPTPNWQVLANFTLQDPTITSYPQTPSNVGHRVPSVPSVLANLWTSYNFQLPEYAGSLRAALGLQYRNKQYADAAQTRIVPGAPVFDMAVQWQKDRYLLAAGVSNIFDRRYFLYGAGTGGVGVGVLFQHPAVQSTVGLASAYFNVIIRTPHASR
jgi:iron complex outermembrane receptor protein